MEIYKDGDLLKIRYYQPNIFSGEFFKSENSLIIVDNKTLIADNWNITPKYH